jgi:transposase
MGRVTGEMRLRRLPGATSAIVAFCAGLAGLTRVAYEAGPTGFALARALTAAGVECVIAAPGKIERPSSDRVKTDQRDAERLLRLRSTGCTRFASRAARRRRCAISSVRARTSAVT